MTIQKHIDYMNNVKLEEAIRVFDNSYYFHDPNYGAIFILVDKNKNKVGYFWQYDIADIAFYIKPEYENQHYLSNFIKSEVWKPYFRNNDQVSITSGLITSKDDLFKKIYIIENLLGMKIINRDEVNRYLKYFRAKERNNMLSKDEDLMLMSQQDLIYNIIKNFLKSDLAIKANISGINVKVENGYVNASWNFNKRSISDIKE